MLVGLYVHGSLALGAFQHGLSDIDFITITSRRCTASDLASLRIIHQTLTNHYPTLPMEGSYLQWDEVGQFEDTIGTHPYIHDGILHAKGYHDINAVTWWILQNHGITVSGPTADRFNIQVDWAELAGNMHHNLNSYWASFTSHPVRMGRLLADDGIQWAVLGILRQFYSFREGSITSKIGAGIYGLEHLPPWRQLIQEAINIRERRGPSLYRSRVTRAMCARAFLQHIINTCNTNTQCAQPTTTIAGKHQHEQERP